VLGASSALETPKSQCWLCMGILEYSSASRQHLPQLFQAAGERATVQME